jgi:hypothetical protein
MKASREFRRSVSYHEAGHAVVARVLGVEIVGVDMTGNNGASVRIRPAT